MSLSVRLRHDFPGFAMDLAFEAPPGVTVLFGRSGSGKSTVMRAVAGLMRPDGGRVALEGRTLFDGDRRIHLPPHRRRLGVIFQEARLFPHLSVAENLRYGARFAPRGGAEDTARVVEMLGIGALLGRRPGALSGGEKARVAIGRALLSRPRMILADEPLAALDAPRKAEILPYFERLRDEAGVPVLYVSHAAEEVARLATTVVALENGRVLRQGSAAEVLGDARVMPTGVRSAGAVIEAVLHAHHPDGLSELDAAGIALFLPCIDRAPGARIRLRIAAQDVMLATARPQDISALNLLPGTVAAVLPGQGPGAMVTVDTAAGRILARITGRSARALGLAPGVPVWAVIKSVAVAPGGIGVSPP
ncbi:molybdenum ABC transporter ATP-binding protein [Mangrovicoccus algicola]|uniref:Molybdenum ABC transporter ATP-binding protein n=1 Tax=Mangrovicoccus algicola TaxID=2771008 RepID=A0A8J6ZDF3_9RHOB|nr:molybdenum ABC transporter ATP-binding protein [Mangrovicoccus algicola]MBE3639995.1 molybdenum ABC transporter ATP-binding protein [Mangrovicoccus algicola]